MDRPLRLHPADGDPRAPFASGQWVVPVRRPGAEQAGRVEPDPLVLQEPDVQLVDARLGVHVEAAERPLLPGRDLRPDDHRLGRPPLRCVGAVRDPPLRPLPRPGPERIGREPELVPAGRGGAEAGELGLDRLVTAGHHAERLPLPRLRVGAADRRGGLLVEDVRLGLRAEQREGGPLGAPVERAELHQSDEVRLLPGIVPYGRGLRALRPGGRRLAEGIFGGPEVAGHLDVRHVERRAGLVEPMRLAVLGEHVAELEPGGAQEVAEGVLVFVTVEPPPDGPAGCPGPLVVGRCEAVGEPGQECAAVGRSGLVRLLRRHLAVADAVVDRDPPGK